MKNNPVNHLSCVATVGLLLTFFGCNNSKTDRHETNAQSVKIDSTYENVAIPEVLDNSLDSNVLMV